MMRLASVSSLVMNLSSFCNGMKRSAQLRIATALTTVLTMPWLKFDFNLLSHFQKLALTTVLTMPWLKFDFALLSHFQKLALTTALTMPWLNFDFALLSHFQKFESSYPVSICPSLVLRGWV